MLNLGRLTTISDAVKDAQRLDSHMDRRITRLALGLHLCRELADDIMEDAIASQTVKDHKLAPHGRLERQCF
jgi:hypothetical protein